MSKIVLIIVIIKYKYIIIIRNHAVLHKFHFEAN